MRYCHECGAEVANEDIFCLFCGITLQNAATTSEKQEVHPNTDDLLKDGEITLEIAEETDSEIETPAISSDPASVEASSVLPESDKADRLAEDLPQNSAENDFGASLDNLSNPLSLQSATIAPDPELSSGDLQTSQAKIEKSIALSETEDAEALSEPETVFSQPVPVLAWDKISASSLKITSEVVPQIAGEEMNEALVVASTSGSQKTGNIGEKKVLDENLQPTLIGQNSDLLVPNEEAPASATADKTNEQPNIVSENEFAEPEALPEESANVVVAEPDEIAASISENQLMAASPKPIDETPIIETVNEFIAQPPAANSPVEIAVLTPRQTESNKPQETPGSKSPKLKPLEIGTLLNNRYKVVRRIGGGGMGAVYLAEDQNLGGVLRAVKEMIQAYVDESQQEKAVADFRRESVLLTQLEHPSIPTIYDYFFDEAKGRFYLVMKYISGGDLAARLRAAPESKLDEGSITMWAIQIADVLDYLHNRQPPIVYRDLKPSNIMLDGASNKAMLIDFGIARWVNKEEKGVTAVGTMGYAPPELFAGNAEPRSDIYSLGATMFHLLTGADPQSNPLLIFDFTKNPRPRQINLMLSVEMEDILLRSVEYNAGLRFESAAKMRDQLQEHLEKLKAGRLTFERSNHNIAQVMPIPAQAPPAVPFAAQPQVNMVFCGFCGEKIIATDMFCAYCGAPQASTPSGGGRAAANNASPRPNQSQQSGGSQQQQMQQTMMSGKMPDQAQQLSSVTARLVVLGTSELDAPLFKLEKENNLVGREDRRANIFPEIDLSKFDNKAQVSRRHARIWREGSAYMVEDLKSSNGTVLITDDNQTMRLQANQPHVLQHGDKLKLGDTTLRFYVN